MANTLEPIFLRCGLLWALSIAFPIVAGIKLFEGDAPLWVFLAAILISLVVALQPRSKHWLISLTVIGWSLVLTASLQHVRHSETIRVPEGVEVGDPEERLSKAWDAIIDRHDFAGHWVPLPENRPYYSAVFIAEERAIRIDFDSGLRFDQVRYRFGAMQLLAATMHNEWAPSPRYESFWLDRFGF